jgi:oxazoline/thiazoline synthase
MIKEPAFKEHFHVAVIPPHAVYLLTERGHTVLTGRLFALLAPLLDGSHTVGAIIDALGDQVTAAEVYYALMHLEDKGYIRNANVPLSN